MKVLFFSILMTMAMHVVAQSDYDRGTDKENNEVVFKGQITFDDLLKEPSFDWLHKGMEGYNPDKDAIAYLQKELPNYEVVVFLGTWCEDSHLQIPKLYKILMASQYPMRRYSMYGVDRAKTTKYVENKLYKIELVPTIILFKKNAEVGRIVESPKKNIEDDLVDMIKKDKAINK
jgi:hypothetical protein